MYSKYKQTEIFVTNCSAVTKHIYGLTACLLELFLNVMIYKIFYFVTLAEIIFLLFRLLPAKTMKGFKFKIGK